MSRRFVTLLQRSAGVRHLIEREEKSRAPRSVRLMRLKKLQLQLSESLRNLSAKQLIAMASAPRFTPKLMFREIRTVPILTRGWPQL